MELTGEKEIKTEAKVHVISFYSFLYTSISLIFIGILIKLFVHDVLDVQFISAHFNLPLSEFVAEKSEKIQYYLLTFLFPFIYIFMFKLVSKFKSSKSFDKKFLFISALEFILAVFIFIDLNFLDSEKYFFKIHSSYLIIAMLLVVGLYLTYLYQVGTVKFKKSMDIVLYSILAFFLAVVFWIHFVPSYAYDYINLHHFESYYYPIYKVFSGLTIGYDFNCLYGLYPYIYEPFLKLTGGVSIPKISFISSFLIILSSLSIAAALWFYIKNKVLYFLSVVSFVYFLCILPLISTNGYYLQFLPHRTIFLSLMIAVCALYLNIKNKTVNKAILYLGYVVSFFSIIWNFETGFIVLAVWIALLIYLQLYRFKLNNKKLYLNISKILLSGILVLFAVFAVICMIPYFRIGKFISLSNYFEAQSLFYNSGYFMIKMKLFSQPWLLPILIYMVALIKSINVLRFMGNNKDKFFDVRKSAMYFVLAVIGFGIFVYYQGRSHILVLGVVVFPAVVLSGLFMQEYFNKFLEYNSFKSVYKELSKIYLLKFLAFFIMFSLSVGAVFQLFFVKNLIKSLSMQRTRIQNPAYFSFRLDYIKDVAKNEKNIDIIAQNASLYYTELKMKDKLSFSAVPDWATKESYYRVLDWLNKTDNTVIFDLYSLSQILKYEPQKAPEVLKRRFKLVATYSNLLVFKPKQMI